MVPLGRIYGALLLCAGCLMVPFAASADVLVLRDGSRVETRGAWEVKGATVVFTLDTGTLGSLRLRDVDLDASAAATAEQKAPPPPPIVEPPKRQAVLTLTDADVSRAPDEVIAAAEQGVVPAAPTTPTAPAPAAPAGLDQVHVAVESWEESYDPDAGGVRVTGLLRNTGPSSASGISVSVEVFGEAGARLAESPARVGSAVLPAGQTVGFSVVFPGLDIVREVKFRVRHNTMVFEAPPPAASPAATTE